MVIRRSRPAVATVAVAAVLGLAGCGSQAANVPLTDNSSSAEEDAATDPTPAADPQAGAGDGAPHWAENHAGRAPGDMSPADEAAAKKKARQVERLLEDLRSKGRISPRQVRSELLGLGLAEKEVTVGELRQGNLLEGYKPVAGADYGIWIGRTACVTGAVSKDRVWVDVDGHYPETGCMSPPPAH